MLSRASLRDDQDSSCRIPYRRMGTLPIRPSPGMRLPGAVRKDHLALVRMLCFARERQLPFISGCISYLDAFRDPRDIEHGHRDRERERDRIAEINQRVNPRERPFFPEAPQQ